MKNLSQQNAKALWDWKGEAEHREIKTRIAETKKTLQKLASKAVSRKGDTLKQLEAINVLSGQAVIDLKYLKTILSIKEMSEL